MNIETIAAKINAAGQTYYGEKARAWSGNDIARIYFGKDYVTLENGEVHNRTAKARAKSIGDSAVTIVASAI